MTGQLHLAGKAIAKSCLQLATLCANDLEDSVTVQCDMTLSSSLIVSMSFLHLHDRCDPRRDGSSGWLPPAGPAAHAHGIAPWHTTCVDRMA